MSDIIPFATGDTSDPYWSDVSLLIQPTSTIIEDLSPQGLTLTAHGDADNIPRGVVDPSSPTGYSIYFPSATSSTDGYIGAGVGIQATLGSASTLEFLFRSGSTASRGIVGAIGWNVGYTTGLRGLNNFTVNPPIGTLTIDGVTWNWVVIQRNGGRVTTWINGTVVDAGSNNGGPVGGSGNELFIGRDGGTYYLQGHIALMRITQATRYKPDYYANVLPFPTS